MIDVSTEERIRKLIIDGATDQTISKSTSVSCVRIRKIRRTMTLVGYIDDQLKEQVVMRLCGGYTHKQISEIMKIDKEIISAINRFCYLRSKRKIAKMPTPLCAACKANIDALNNEPCWDIDVATNEDIEHEARPMFEIICNIVGLDGLCIVASPIFGAIAREAGQIKGRVMGEENGKCKTETKRSCKNQIEE